MKNYHKNPRQIKDKQFANLRTWLLELGDLSGIVHDLVSDEVISGNQRMRAIDIAKCEIVLTEGPHDPDAQGTVAHGYVIWQGAKYNYRQVRWTPEQCEKANIVANKAGGSWDFDVLANEFEKDDLLEWGFELEELGMFPDDETPEDPGAQVDRAEELREKWGVVAGQTWAMGEHRLAVGDCTDAAVVARVMGGEKAGAVVTDVPYGISQQSNGLRRLDYGEWDKGQATDVAFGALSLCADVPTITAFCGDEQLSLLFALWPNRTKRTVVWVKPNPTVINGEHVFLPACELAAHGRLPGAWFGGKCVRSVWEGTAPAQRDHPTQKPLELIEWVVSLTCDAGAIVFDPFLGSGTTMVAAQRLGRRCFGVEIDPGYAAVTLQRMSDMGLTPELVAVNSEIAVSDG